MKIPRSVIDKTEDCDWHEAGRVRYKVKGPYWTQVYGGGSFHIYRKSDGERMIQGAESLRDVAMHASDCILDALIVAYADGLKAGRG